MKGSARPRLFSTKRSVSQQPNPNQGSQEKVNLLNTPNGESIKRVQIISPKTTTSEDAQKDSIMETVGSLPERKVINFLIT